MSRSSSLKAKVDKVLLKANATDRKVYKREYITEGGDSLTGRGRTTRTVDRALSPPPAVTQLRQEDLLTLSGTTQIQISDLLMTVSASTLTRKDLANKDLTIVMKTRDTEEEYKILAFTSAVLEGENIVFNLLIRSNKR